MEGFNRKGAERERERGKYFSDNGNRIFRDFNCIFSWRKDDKFDRNEVYSLGLNLSDDTRA